MKLKLALLDHRPLGFGTTAALAEEAPGANSDITIVAETPSGTNGRHGCRGRLHDLLGALAHVALNRRACFDAAEPDNRARP
jgi:hypothetical protein